MRRVRRRALLVSGDERDVAGGRPIGRGWLEGAVSAQSSDANIVNAIATFFMGPTLLPHISRFKMDF